MVQERVTNLREHREFEKEFEVKTQLTGERQLDRGAEVCSPLQMNCSDSIKLSLQWLT